MAHQEHIEDNDYNDDDDDDDDGQKPLLKALLSKLSERLKTYNQGMHHNGSGRLYLNFNYKVIRTFILGIGREVHLGS